MWAGGRDGGGLQVTPSPTCPPTAYLPAVRVRRAVSFITFLSLFSFFPCAMKQNGIGLCTEPPRAPGGRHDRADRYRDLQVPGLRPARAPGAQDRTAARVL